MRKGAIVTSAFLVGTVLIYFVSQQIPYINLIDIDLSYLTGVIVVSILWMLRPSVQQVASFCLVTLLVVLIEHTLYLTFLDKHAGIILFIGLFYLLLQYVSNEIAIQGRDNER
ncbi:MAG: hypothetical protein Q8Q49_03195 [bacterium]|nr:hypothetical protein [bacterium]